MSDEELLTALQQRFTKLMDDLAITKSGNGSMARNGADTDIEGS